jgi:hypothetical protein
MQMDPEESKRELTFLTKANKTHPSDGVRDLVEQLRHVKVQPFRKIAVKKFWEQIENDLIEYEKHIHNEQPLEETCYSKHPKCLRKCDNALWLYLMTGFRSRKFVAIYNKPMKMVSVAVVFIAGLLRLVRANQDGKASFWANVFTAMNQAILIVLMALDGEDLLLLPKIMGLCVALAVIYGIVQNANGEALGL